MTAQALDGIHEIITGEPDDETIVALLAARYGADLALDPGPTAPLAHRLVQLGPSLSPIEGTRGRFEFSGPDFIDGERYDVDGREVHIFRGRPGAETRTAYFVEDPATCVSYSRYWQSWGPVHESVFVFAMETLMDDLTESATKTRIALTGDAGHESGLSDAVRNAVPLGAVEFKDRQFVIPDGVIWVLPDDTEAIVNGDPASAQRHLSVEVRTEDASAGGRSERQAVSGQPDELPAICTLDQLDLVPWGDLRGPYGPVSELPDSLRELAGATPESLHDVVARPVMGSTWHQGSRYEPSAYAVPFIGGLLVKRPEIAEYLLEMLTDLALGFEDEHFPLPHVNGSGTTGPDSCCYHGTHADVTVAAIGKLWPALVGLLGSDDDAVVIRSVRLLGYLGDQASQSLEELSKVQATTATRPALLLATAMLGRHLGVPAEELPTFGPNHPDHRAVELAALALGGDRDARVELLRLLDSDPDCFAGWIGRDAGNAMMRMLDVLGSLDGWPALDDLTEFFAVARANPGWSSHLETVFRIVRAVLPDILPRHAAELGERSRAVLEGVRDLNSLGGKINDVPGLKGGKLAAYLDGELDVVQ